jgi:hypothetical protein
LMKPDSWLRVRRIGRDTPTLLDLLKNRSIKSRARIYCRFRRHSGHGRT